MYTTTLRDIINRLLDTPIEPIVEGLVGAVRSAAIWLWGWPLVVLVGLVLVIGTLSWLSELREERNRTAARQEETEHAAAEREEREHRRLAAIEAHAAEVRAYRLAEELGMSAHQFLERARAAGVELRNDRVLLDKETVALLRRKLGWQPTAEDSPPR